VFVERIGISLRDGVDVFVVFGVDGVVGGCWVGKGG